MTEQQPSAGARDINRVFSVRLDGFLTQVLDGETPNSGTFCGFCYNPIPVGFDRCDHCGQIVQDPRQRRMGRNQFGYRMDE